MFMGEMFFVTILLAESQSFDRYSSKYMYI